MADRAAGVWDGGETAQARNNPDDHNNLIGFHSPVDKSLAVEGKKLIENFKIRGLGSSTLHLAYAAIGLIDGVVEYNNKVWDIAAAAALVEESGSSIHYLTPAPFPMKEFTLKAGRVQYLAGSAGLVARLRETLGR